MAYYKEKVETGNEYVMVLKNFYMYTLNKCLKLPNRWYETVLKPVIDSAERARTNAVKANKVYVNFNNQSPEEFKKSIELRDNYLHEALRDIVSFDVAFDVLLSYIDIDGYEKERIANKLEEIIKTIKCKNPDLKSIEIKLLHRENEMSFVSLAGVSSNRIRVTPQNISHWISLEANAEKSLKNRIMKDKQLIKNVP